MTTSKVKEEWAKFIMSQALMEFDGHNRAEIIERVEGTALGVRPDLINIFKELLDAKEKLLKLRRGK